MRRGKQSCLPVRRIIAGQLVFWSMVLPHSGYAQQIKIVGIGAASCSSFLQEIDGNTAVERDYFAWAQGYMSGLLIRAPADNDEDLDLTPTRFPILKQAAFLRTYCAAHAGEYFTDAANELYRTLRAPPG
jgi:hypothetical protein